MAKPFLRLNRLLKLTYKHIRRNLWLSSASMLVITFSFLMSTIFVVLGISSNNALKAVEKSAQIIVFFERDTEEEEIIRVKEIFEDFDATEEVTYISQKEAEEDFKRDFEDDVELVESVVTGALPASLEIKSNDLDEIDSLLKQVVKEKEKNKNITEVLYFQDFVERLNAAVSFLRVGGLALIIFLNAVSLILIFVAIGFNITTHRDEIKTMKLIGSTIGYIRMPYIIEGSFYGLIGALVSSVFIQATWFIAIESIKQSELYILVSTILDELDLISLLKFDIQQLLIMVGLTTLAGIIIGAISSFLSAVTYIKTDL